MATHEIPVILRGFKIGWGDPDVHISDEELAAYKKHLRQDVERYLLQVCGFLRQNHWGRYG